jgi:hypothetical protein
MQTNMYITAIIALFGFYSIPAFAAEPQQLTLEIDHFTSTSALQQYLTNNGEAPKTIIISASRYHLQELAKGYFAGDLQLLCDHGFLSYKVFQQ